MLKEFFENARDTLKSESDGCMYHHIEDGLYAVCAYNAYEKCVLAKIAYNCDDLQCDYDIDWYVPCTVGDRECLTVEDTITDTTDCASLSEYFVTEAHSMVEARDSGELEDWH